MKHIHSTLNPNAFRPLISRALVIAAVWGASVSALSVFQALGRNLAQPHIRTLAEIAPKKAAPKLEHRLAANDGPWQGPLPLVAGSPWVGNPENGVLTATFGDAEWFVPGSVELNLVGRAAVKSISDSLAGLPARRDQINIAIEAHSDSSPVVRLKAKFPTNWELTGARAFAVVREFESLGLASKHLSGTGLADSRPVSALQALNRRIQVTVRFTPPASSSTLMHWEVAQR